jgi:CheY-like chemotaxis protein
MVMPRNARVLAVDDKPANLIALQAVLDDTCQLVLAHSGAESVSTLEHDGNFDVILMDIQMPGMDGYETAARIKKMPGLDDIPLVFSPRSLARIRRSGAGMPPALSTTLPSRSTRTSCGSRWTLCVVPAARSPA